MLIQDVRQPRNGSRFPKRSRTEPAIPPQLTSEIVRRKTEAANGLKFSETAFFFVISLKHPSLHVGMLLQPLSNGLHRIASGHFVAIFLPRPRQNPPATPNPPRLRPARIPRLR